MYSAQSLIILWHCNTILHVKYNRSFVSNVCASGKVQFEYIQKPIVVKKSLNYIAHQNWVCSVCINNEVKLRKAVVYNISLVLCQRQCVAHIMQMLRDVSNSPHVFPYFLEWKLHFYNIVIIVYNNVYIYVWHSRWFSEEQIMSF